MAGESVTNTLAMSKFMYFSKSADAAPGCGACEHLEEDDDFSELAEISNWRRKLSNFYIAPFDLDGKLWNSVEHFYQGSKFKNGNPEFYDNFAVGGQYGHDSAIAKAAGGKSGKLNGVLLRPVEVVMDADFFNGQDDICMQRAMEAKFTQNETLREILILTDDAELWHKTRGIPLTRMVVLENVRALLGT